ncbi:Rpn family recombination-promoting nuclease/putative transposase [Roseospira goensis]|uniref:Putative transposase YdaD n=1 Tax=Roseospira goensis TaxID=391922 RepID=A0A7W6WJI0_9PROT|nr:Rpn family recombination-promoting nuclease/putative transposase [Roseospira goensis]MBB4285030.1 putative transposase YdaD [Roseospira goensis]
MASHDTGYKLLFSHPEMVRDLITGFVPGDWVRAADFSTLAAEKASFVSDDEKERHDDLIWRVRIGDRWLWVYLLLEFQSSPDPWMAIRIMVYMGLLAQDLVRRRALHDGRLPPILPIVLYNGGPSWTAAVDVKDCFVEPPAGLQPARPRLTYHLVDEARLALHPDGPVRNLSEALFRLEHSRTPGDVRRVLQALDVLLRDPDRQALRRAFGLWVKRLLRRRVPASHVREVEAITDIMEADSMLAERIETWFEEAGRNGLAKGLAKGLEQGLEQGLQEGRVQGAETAKRQVARNLLALGVLTEDQIAAAVDLSVDEIRALRDTLDR